ncbi:ribosome-associated protein [Nocardioides terrae]|uniref:Ribosome-associated protein n=1 Tax=Nocardioides terrae TaxID=574651 RepID=A0A1I1DLM1_9ACTN|nr:RNA-binding S4 domain-containing protein [Nocardioides terrae]SFB73413.1 ribosome-associated protein [Nocardioides terrae]
MPVFGRKKQSQEPEPEDVPIREEMIRLGQFLKLAGLVEHGGEAKEVIAAGAVSVNGEVDTRRGRQLHVGDVVRLGSGSESRAARVADQATYEDDLPW